VQLRIVACPDAQKLIAEVQQEYVRRYGGRMYVVPSARGRGLSREVLAELERSAVAAGRRRMVLETGTRQPEAIDLYATSGYTEITTFGEHRCSSYSRCFGKILVRGRPEVDPGDG